VLFFSALENATWHSISQQISVSDANENCDTFYEKKDGLDAICCRVRMGTKPFAFCTYDHLLFKSVPKNNIHVPEKDVAVDYNEIPTSYRWRVPRRPLLGGFKSPVSLFVDLFKVPCDSAEVGSLCTQYCCENERGSSLFCESKLKCF